MLVDGATQFPIGCVFSLQKLDEKFMLYYMFQWNTLKFFDTFGMWIHEFSLSKIMANFEIWNIVSEHFIKPKSIISLECSLNLHIFEDTT